MKSTVLDNCFLHLLQPSLLAKSSHSASMEPLALKTELEVTCVCVPLGRLDRTVKSTLIIVRTSHVRMKVCGSKLYWCLYFLILFLATAVSTPSCSSPVIIGLASALGGTITTAILAAICVICFNVKRSGVKSRQSMHGRNATEMSQYVDIITDRHQTTEMTTYTEIIGDSQQATTDNRGKLFRPLNNTRNPHLFVTFISALLWNTLK